MLNVPAYIEPMSIKADTCLHFSKKDFHERGWDKHMLYGGAIAFGVGGFAAAYRISPEAAAIGTGVIVGLSVELFDYLDNRMNSPKPPHEIEIMDVVFTAAGGVVAAFLLHFLTK